MTDDDIIERVLRYEGGFVDHPNDKGGPTNFGITAASLGAWRRLGRSATREEVRGMTRSEAKAIYARRYIADPGFGAIPDTRLRMIVVDCAVLYGPKRAAIWLQTALGVTADGKIGSMTRAVLARADARVVSRKILSLRFQRIAWRVRQDRTQMVFYKGWMNRTNDLLQYAA